MTPEKLYFHIIQCVPEMYDSGFITADHPDCHDLPRWDQSISSFIYLGVCNIVSFCWKTPSVEYLIFSNEAWEKTIDNIYWCIWFQLSFYCFWSPSSGNLFVWPYGLWIWFLRYEYCIIVHVLLCKFNQSYSHLDTFLLNNDMMLSLSMCSTSHFHALFTSCVYKKRNRSRS